MSLVEELSPSQYATLVSQYPQDANLEAGLGGLASTGSGIILLPDTSDLSNIEANDINDVINGNNVSNTDELATELPLLESDTPISDLQTVYAMPYDPNVAAEAANVTAPITQSPAYSGGGGINWKMWIALGVIALGLLIFRKKIGKVVDKLV